LHEVYPIILKLERALLEEQRAQYELSRINNIFWLSRFARNNPDNVPIKLKARAEKCQMQLSHAQAQVSRLSSQLEPKYPGLFGFLEIHRDQIGRRPPFVSHKNRLTKRRQLMQRRNQIIRQYADQSALVICHKLDNAFPTRDDSPAPHLPRSWCREFHVTTFVQAYLNSPCRPRVETLISRVRHDLRIR